MAVNKNFVVKNGLEVNTDLIFADPSSNRVGIASTIPSMLLDVQGGIACTDIQVSGVATIATGIITSAVCDFLNVTGISTLAGALSFEDLSVTGIGTIRTGILTEAYIHFLSNASGVTTTGNLNVTGLSTFSNTIKVGSGVTIQSHGGLSIAGIMTVGGDLNVAGDITYDEIGGRNLNITGIATLASAKVSDLTAGRVVTAGTGGELQDASTFTFSGGTVTATAFAGDLTGDVTGNTDTFTVTANNSTDETVFPIFVDGATGAQGAESDTGLTYNPNSGTLTATKFSGDGSLITGVASTDNIVTGTAVTITNNVNISGITTVSNNVNITGITTTTAIADQTGSVGTANSILSSTGTALAWINANTTSVDNASKVGTNANSTDATQFVAFLGASTGNNPVRVNTGFTINPSNNKLTVGALDVNGGVITLDANADTTITADTDDQIDIAFGGNDRITMSTGLISIKNDGSQSQVRLYCESSNAHYLALQAPAHSAFSGNPTVTLPASTTTLVGRDTTDTLTNKTLTSPTITGTGNIAGTFTGNVTGTASNASGATGDFSIADKIIHTGDTNTAIRFPAADTFTVETAGSERLRITSDGKIGIGEDDPDGNYLLIRAASTVATTKGHIMLTGDSATNGQGPQIVFSESGSSSSFAGAYVGHVREGTNSIGRLVFGTRSTGGDANTVPTERLRITSAGNVSIKNDSGKFTAGTDDDLEIYHDGINSVIDDTGTGDLILRGAGQGIKLQKYTGETMAQFLADGKVSLRYDDVEKFETTSSGVTVTGAVSDSKGELRKLIANTQSGTYTLVASDSGKYVWASNTVTIPNNVFSAGDMVTIVNDTNGNLTLTKDIATMYLSADGTSDNRTLSAFGMATILFVSGTAAYITGSGLS